MLIIDWTRAALMGYVECALWSSVDENGNHFDDIDFYDLADITLVEMLRDVVNFTVETWSDVRSYVTEGRTWEQFGHDFWLTRNGHGAGFWDRGLGELGTRLTEAAKVYGESNIYVGDDGKFYV